MTTAAPSPGLTGTPVDDAAAPPRRLSRWLPLPGQTESGLDLRNTWQIVAGAILLPVGIAVIILGWAGAAHGRIDQQQIPYLISGGILGLALVMVGCFFYWAHWLYRIYDQADLHHQAAMAEQKEFNRALLAALSQRGGVEVGATTMATPSPTLDGWVATATGTNFHTASCAIVANRPGLRSVDRKAADKMRPCRICEPLKTK